VGCLVVSILADIGYQGSLRATSPRSPSPATGEIYVASYQGATFYVTADQKGWMRFPEYGAELSLLAIALTTYAYNRRREQER
jgi:hypothetical protein